MSSVAYETVIGLEIHVQLNTLSKAFCSDANNFGDAPNSNVSVISLAHPGTLPKMNVLHLEKAIRLAIALDSRINSVNYFDRKNYFYPDLPKGYQITQDKMPYCRGGEVKFWSDGKEMSIRLHHIHMEEDAGKSNHELHAEFSLVDINRAGVPLLEIVTEPDFRSGAEVSDFLSEMQRIVQYLDISDANMEEGSFRCDCNVSVRKKGVQTLGERCEIKNLNSRRFAKIAIEYEAKRQIEVLEQGGEIYKTTMLFDPVKGITRPMRKKESENDYRYFPEPDLPPVVITQEYIKEIKSGMGILPFQSFMKIKKDFGLNESDADTLCDTKQIASLFLSLCDQSESYKEIADLLILKIIPYAKSKTEGVESLKSEKEILDFVSFVSEGKSSKSALYQQVFPVWIEEQNADIRNIAENLGIIKEDNQSFLDDIIKKVLQNNPDKVKEYKSGKKGLIGFFMGQVKQIAGGKADPVVLKEKLTEHLNDE